MNHEDGTLFRGKLPEAPLELVACSNCGLTVRGRAKVRTVNPDFDHPSRRITLRHGIAAVDQEPADPGVEAVRVSKGPDSEPRPDQGFLHRLLCSIIAPENQARCLVEPVNRARDQRSEGIVVSRLRPHDHFSLQGTLPSSIATSGRIHQAMSLGGGRSFHLSARPRS